MSYMSHEQAVARAALIKRLEDWPRKRDELTAERDALIREAAGDGMSNMEIADRIDVSRTTVIRVLGDAGTHEVWYVGAGFPGEHVATAGSYAEAVRAIRACPPERWPSPGFAGTPVLMRENTAGFRLWEWRDATGPVIYQIMRRAPGVSGLCSAHAYGEDMTCRICFSGSEGENAEEE